MKRIFLILSLLTAFTHAEPAAGPDPAIAKMREQLKTTMLQLRTAQGDAATLQAAKDEAEAANKDLKAKLEQALKNSADDKARTDKDSADAKAKIADQEARLVKANESLKQWQDAFKKMESTAQGKENDRARLADEVIKLDRKALDRENKNLELYQLGKEILTRYENYGLGRALLSKEPFTGLSKVKLETLVQDYKDKLQDAKVKPNDAQAKPKPTAPSQPTVP